MSSRLVSLAAAAARRRPAEAKRARGWLDGAVRRHLAARAELFAAASAERALLLPAIDALDDALASARNRLDPGPFRADMTVHAAHLRHPEVRAVFARHGLPGCPDCAVGVDETLAEAAGGEGFSVDELVAELRALEI
jgi:hypothetical protein